MPSKRCHVKGCRARPGMAGLCRWCDASHCGQHRLPESHTCPGIHQCRDHALRVNEERLVACAPARLERV